MRRRRKYSLMAAAGAVAATLMSMLPVSSASAYTTSLTRYPYLTDVVSAGSTDNATINWATDISQTTGYATYGLAGTEACTAHRANGSKTGMTVNGVAEEQWKAKITGLTPGASYCYRVFFSNPTVDLLATDTSPVFPTPSASSSFKFAVFGDWGDTVAPTDQANVDAQIAGSGAQFLLGTGDTAYNSGSQTNYGDLYQTGSQVSAVFAPNFFKNIGNKIPLFNALGNHGQTTTFLNVWPMPTAPSLSGGRYQMDTYCCVNGTTSRSLPSVWYAFTVGNARFYILDATWPNGNLGTGTIYSDDAAAHWSASSPEYQWLAGDLAAHPGGLKFVAEHFPMYSDSSTEGTDPYLHGTGSLAELLTQYGVQMVFNGHAHIYQRNTQQAGESFVSYVTGGGGSVLEPVGTAGCHSYDAYAIGWSPTKLKGYKCGAAPVPTSPAAVFHYLLVTVNGTQVTVAPTNESGQQFDVITYNF
jgi:hypothetical protein